MWHIQPADRRPGTFQSTLPVWGATFDGFGGHGKVDDFNPRSPCGERPYKALRPSHGRNFNPRSPCGERHNYNTYHQYTSKFQSTLPVWGATGSHTQGDGYLYQFQSTLPVWGATSRIHTSCLAGKTFQSTLPVWGATAVLRMDWVVIPYFNPRSPCGERRDGCGGIKNAPCRISIHAPRVGSDEPEFHLKRPRCISIHAPRVGSDWVSNAPHSATR